MVDVVLAHLNIHSDRAAIEAAGNLGADIFSYNETRHLVPYLRKHRKRYRIYAAPAVRYRQPNGKLRLTTTDCVTLVRKRHDYLGQWHQQVSEQVRANLMIAPNRTFTLASFAINGTFRTAHLNMHPNAGPKILRNPSSRSKVAEEYHESIEWAETMLRAYKEKGYRLLASGDVNIPAGVTVPWSPHKMFRDLGMTYRTDGLDLVAWQSSKFRLESFKVIPKAVVRSDHPALRARLKVVA